MKLRLRFTGSLILLLAGFNGIAQSESDSTRNYFSIDASIDYGKFVTLLLDNQTKYEGEVGIMYNRYRILGEYGISEIDSDEIFDNAKVQAKGSYYRLGFDYLLPINAKNNLFLGLRYAAGDFDQSILVDYNSSVFNSFLEENDNLKARWYEIVISSETKLFAQFFLGFKARIRIMDSYDNPGVIGVIEVPGYGRTYDKSVMALNLYIRYRIIFR